MKIIDDAILLARYGFAVATPASPETLALIRAGVLEHITGVKNVPRIVTRTLRPSNAFANCEVRLTGELHGTNWLEFRKLLRDSRVLDWQQFQGTDFVYFFLDTPSAAQRRAQSLGVRAGEALCTIRVRGADLLAFSPTRVYFRRGVLGWEADKAVIVRGGYRGPAQLTPPEYLPRTTFP